MDVQGHAKYGRVLFLVWGMFHKTIASLRWVAKATEYKWGSPW